MMEAINNGDGEMNPELMFNMFDANGDGQVTTSEWFDWSNTTDEANARGRLRYVRWNDG